MKINSPNSIKDSIGLRNLFELSLNPNFSSSGLPYWAAFYVWLGWYLRKTEVANGGRRICFILVPNKRLVSLLLAFGAQIAGAQKFVEGMDWDAFKNLEFGSNVYLYIKKTSNKSGTKQILNTVGEKFFMNDQEFIRLSEVKNPSNTRAISRDHLETYTITYVPATRKTIQAMGKNSTFFQKLLNEYDQQWLLANGFDSVIVGELESIKNEASELFLRVKGGVDKPIPLLQLLGLDSADGASHKKTGFLKIRANEFDDVTTKLCILDGVLSYKAYEESQDVTGATTMVSIIESSRINDQIDDAVATWKSHARQLGEHGELSVELPLGVECSIFSA
jgi:hypothetical protein